MYDSLRVIYLFVPSPEFLHLPILLLLQLGDKTLQDRHLKLDILRHLVEEKRKVMTKQKKRDAVERKIKGYCHTLSQRRSKTHSFMARSHFSVSLRPL